MNNPDQWPHKWFGVWREYGHKYKDCPSVYDFVVPQLEAMDDQERLREYLLNGQIVASTSRANFPCPFTSTRHQGSISFRTDGDWLWLDDLSQYIEKYHVVIPSAWHRLIKARNYELRPVDQQAIMSLEWPPTSR